MGNVTHLWNPRGNHRLRRFWVSFEDQILIDGESSDQVGVLSLRPASPGQMLARLQAMGHDFEEAVSSGNDLAIWINGLKLFIGVKAIDDTRMLIAFGIQPGSKVHVTLEATNGAEDSFRFRSPAGLRAFEDSPGCHIGICQTRH